MPISEEKAMAEERALADPAVSLDVSPTLTPENFDLDAWIDGVRPTRRKVKLYPNAHLIAQLEEIADRIDATPEDEDVDDLVEQYDRIRAQFRTGVWFTVEKRSSEWVTDLRKRTAKRLGIKLDADGDPDSKDDNVTLRLEQLAQQIVEPMGVTVEHLRSMLNSNEGELVKLMSTLDTVQAQLAENAGVLNRDFSQRLSRARRTS